MRTALPLLALLLLSTACGGPAPAAVCAELDAGTLAARAANYAPCAANCADPSAVCLPGLAGAPGVCAPRCALPSTAAGDPCGAGYACISSARAMPPYGSCQRLCDADGGCPDWMACQRAVPAVCVPAPCR